jgi:predicted nicotinamide N-methyase
VRSNTITTNSEAPAIVIVEECQVQCVLLILLKSPWMTTFLYNRFMQVLRELTYNFDAVDADDVVVAEQLLSELEQLSDSAFDADFERVGLSAACIKFGDAFCQHEQYSALVDRCVALAVRLTPNERAHRPKHHYRFGDDVVVQLSERKLAASQLGSYLYLSGLLLASLLVHHVEVLAGRLVVELGAGRALTSMAAAVADRVHGGSGMRRLVITDGEDAVVDNIGETLLANRAALDAERISVRRYAFGDAWPADEQRAELLIATDVCYELVHALQVADALDAVLAPHGRGTALITCGVRYVDVWQTLLRLLAERRYAVVRVRLDVVLADSGRHWHCAAKLLDGNDCTTTTTTTIAADDDALRAFVAPLLADAPQWLDAACRAPGNDLTRLLNCGTFFGSDSHQGGIELLAVRSCSL